MAKKHIDIAAPPKGLWLDTPKNVQPEGTYSYALNAMSLSDFGEEGIIANEIGNAAVFNLPDGYVLLGALPTSSGETILFSAEYSTLRIGNAARGEIGIQSPDNDYSTLINSNDFDFHLLYQIQAEIAMLNGCDRVVYFNTPSLYSINIDNIEQYLLDGETVATANASGDGWDVDLMKLFTPYTNARITDITVNDTGGDLPLGTYFAIIQYLDSDLNGTGWMEFTNAIPIIDESYSGTNFAALDGGLNSVLPNTSKSITLTITNLDTSFPYYQVGLIASNDDVRTGYILENAPITSTTSTYTITTQGAQEEVPLNTFTVERAVYENAETLTQINSRLVLGNVKEKQVDHAILQQAVNSFKTSWFTKEYLAEDINNATSYKSPEAFFDFRTHPRDEVIALGIRFRFTDGYITPVYHIPGREQNTGVTDNYPDNVLPANVEANIHNRTAPIDGWDTTLYTVTTSITPSVTEVYIGDADFLGFTDANYTTFDIGYGAGLVPRWLIFNTAIRTDISGTNLIDETNYSEGEMAYWESSLAYPDSVDCDGVRIFPEGNIRHHKLPDATLSSPFAADSGIEYIYPLGIRVFDIDIPTEYTGKIDGIQIVKVKRDDTNMSVIDAGLMSRITLNTHNAPTESSSLHQPGIFNHFAFASEDNYAHGIHTPKVKFRRNSLSATHIKYEKILIDPSVEYTLEDTAPTPQRFTALADFNTVDYNNTYTPRGSISTNRRIITQAYVDADTLLDNVININGSNLQFDNTEQQEVYVTSFLHRGTGPATGVQEETLSDENTYYLANNDGEQAYFYYGSLKKYLPQQYGNISSGIYIPLTANFVDTVNSISDFGGDSFISKMYIRRNFLAGPGDDPGVEGPVNHDETVEYLYRSIWSFYTESQINSAYRHEGTLDTEVYYPKSYTTDSFSFLMLERFTSDDSSDFANEYADLIPNYYALNNDFTQQNEWKISVPLLSTFDYCESCDGEYKTRMPYSEVKTNEGTADAYKIFLSNNYRDLQSDKGEITNLFVTDNKLYAHTEGSLWFVPTATQQIQTSESDLFIGTGTFFGVEPIQVKTVKQGYLGSRQKFATTHTEYGVTFVSGKKVFSLGTDGLNEISAIGLRQFFVDNDLKFPKEVFTLTGVNFPETHNTASGFTVGYISSYDPNKHRLILHKKDYKILPAFTEIYVGLRDDEGTFEVGDIVYDVDTQIFQRVNTKNGSNYTYSAISLEDTDYFSNESYTLSFDMNNKHWISFHSYLPNFMYNTEDYFYSSIITSDAIHEHSSPVYQRFYGSNKDHIIEFTVTDTPINASVAKSIGYISKTKQLYDTKHQLVDKTRTFTDVWVYNDRQSSGKLGISVPTTTYNPADYIIYSADTVKVDNKEGVWKFNGIRDYTITTSLSTVATSEWDDIESFYPIDKVPNPIMHDTTKSQYEVSKFRDTYVSVRLFNTIDPESNYSIVTQYLYNNAKYSNR
jgi:hypothetical protein